LHFIKKSSYPIVKLEHAMHATSFSHSYHRKDIESNGSRSERKTGRTQHVVVKLWI
jgi:hypothetical protein